MSTSNPRQAAFDILVRIEKQKSFAEPLLARALSGTAISGSDRGLLTELVYGVLRRQGGLDHIINQLASIRTDRLERSVLVLLRLGLYQIFHLDRVPVSAAVNETVKLAKLSAPRASGFVNAVLRRADRERGQISYPDRQTDPAGYIAAMHSHPRWLVEQWIQQLGPDEAELLAKSMAGQPPLTIRANTLRIGRDELCARFQQSGIAAVPCVYSPDGLQLPPLGAISGLPGFAQGLFTVQDESSQLAALLLDPRPGQRLLDVCAAPGGKTGHLAQLMGDSGQIIAGDRGADRLRLLHDTLTRLGIGCVSSIELDASAPLSCLPCPPFERILVDAPCSALGVIRRNPEGKWWKSAGDLTELSRTQGIILENAAAVLAVDGVLVYATCSTSREENEVVVDEFLSQHPEFVLEDLRQLFPGWTGLFSQRGMFRSWPHRHGMDGFFAARLRRTA